MPIVKIDKKIINTMDYREYYNYMDFLDDCRAGLMSEVKSAILIKKMDINFMDEIGCTALQWASNYGHVKIVKFLLKNGAKLTRSCCGHTPLYVASSKNHYKIVKVLLQNGANPLDMNKWGFTPLRIALINKHYKVVKILLKYKNKKYRHYLKQYFCNDITKYITGYY